MNHIQFKGPAILPLLEIHACLPAQTGRGQTQAVDKAVARELTHALERIHGQAGIAVRQGPADHKGRPGGPVLALRGRALQQCLPHAGGLLLFSPVVEDCAAQIVVKLAWKSLRNRRQRQFGSGILKRQTSRTPGMVPADHLVVIRQQLPANLRKLPHNRLLLRPAKPAPGQGLLQVGDARVSGLTAGVIVRWNGRKLVWDRRLDAFDLTVERADG